jgi:hypothetical protein
MPKERTVSSKDLKYISLANASLEPIEAEKSAPAEPGPKKGPSSFHPNTRSHIKSERRLEPERREELRFADGRRKKADRRPKKTWDKDKNL